MATNPSTHDTRSTHERAGGRRCSFVSRFWWDVPRFPRRERRGETRSGWWGDRSVADPIAVESKRHALGQRHAGDVAATVELAGIEHDELRCAEPRSWTNVTSQPSSASVPPARGTNTGSPAARPGPWSKTRRSPDWRSCFSVGPPVAFDDRRRGAVPVPVWLGAQGSAVSGEFVGRGVCPERISGP